MSFTRKCSRQRELSAGKQMRKRLNELRAKQVRRAELAARSAPTVPPSHLMEQCFVDTQNTAATEPTRMSAEKPEAHELAVKTVGTL